MATSSMARKTRIAKGIAAKMPETAVIETASAPIQPPAVKFAREKPGATTPMKTSSKVAASDTPRMLSAMRITQAPTAAVLGSSPGNWMSRWAPSPA